MEKLSAERKNKTISAFINEMVGPNIDIQDKIDRRKDQCVVCYFGIAGQKLLKELIKNNGKILV